MNALDRYRDLAAYNAWANTRLYDAAAALPDDAYRSEQGAFFGSIHRTLNHVLVGDTIWMGRFTGDGTPPPALDAVLYDDLVALRAAREAMDARIVGFVAGLDDAALARPFTYLTIVNPSRVAQPLAPALDHFFNHQTHHRGQVHALLTRLSGTAPSLDLINYQRESGRGGAEVTPLSAA
ncbi:DinB family protein [Salinarimonas ramus]|uniref:Damage-inducible protein DinB n=1 Tax=Salinarimonas ramus TaxID=690164 RepID=A0A917V313_9HYPH|nr:DinB family protein [Salinarimonas ramus]GGK27203.1 damage-inducible protein DinB [Salinarimonas ramus]